MEKTIGLIIILLMVVVLSGCGKSIAYPELYVSEGLPQYDNAKVTKIIKDGPTLKDGNLFILESGDDVKKIATYYNDAMKSLGWTIVANNEATETSYANQYNSGDGKYLQLTVSQLTGDTRTISINFMKQ